MNKVEAMKVIKYPYVTEKTSVLINSNNTLTFIVDGKGDKDRVKDAVETIYSVKVEKVNLLITKKGKKAYVRLANEYPASELASKIGIV
ncbi:MAG: 50S ribosomal protein L23 [Nitrososphaeria archaeon]|jgi:large subunit ribosomal protein L23